MKRLQSIINYSPQRDSISTLQRRMLLKCLNLVVSYRGPTDEPSFMIFSINIKIRNIVCN